MLSDALQMYLFAELKLGNRIIQEWSNKRGSYVLLEQDFLSQPSSIPVYITQHERPGVTDDHIWTSSYEDTRNGHWLLAGGNVLYERSEAK